MPTESVVGKSCGLKKGGGTRAFKGGSRNSFCSRGPKTRFFFWLYVASLLQNLEVNFQTLGTFSGKKHVTRPDHAR